MITERISQTPTADVEATNLIKLKQKEIVEAIQNLNNLPDDWMSDDGLSKSVIRDQLQALFTEIGESANSSTQKDTIEQPSNNINNQAEADSIIRNNDIVEKYARPGNFLTIGNIHIPVCESTKKDKSKWNTAPGNVFVSGGKKFSEVEFTKDASGLTHKATPGKLMTFSERHRDQRLESIDTVLEGAMEIKTFKKIMEMIANLTVQYDTLNPDDESYDQQANTISEQLFKFLDPINLANQEIVKNSGVGDIEDFSERIASILKVQQILRDIDAEANEHIPENNKKYKLTPYFESKLAQFATLINRQIGLGNNGVLQEMVDKNIAPDWSSLVSKGITILVGARGTGKNQLADYYCNISNRPLFRYACSPDKEERDLTYDIELQDGNVVRIPTRILTAITTPNAVLELDEINLLKPNVAKFFNSLFDGDRAIYLNDQVIKAAPGVIMVGLMNNADYDGVEDLPDTIDDRANIMEMGYPPLRYKENNSGVEKFGYDEALILKDHISPLRKISDQQFIEIWESVVNNVGSVPGLDDEVIDIINDLKGIILIANRTRLVAESNKKRVEIAMRLERDISLRGSIDAAKFYSENELWKADLSTMQGWKQGWNAAQFAIATTYLPHTDTYRKGVTDRKSISLILSETI
jgi:MoxR-like ATPase